MSKDGKKTKEIEVRQAPSVLPDSQMPVKKGDKNDKGRIIKPAPVKRYDASGEIQKFGLQPTELFEYVDPFTREKKRIMIDRRGTTEETLALALLDDKMPRERKDSILSMFLFEQGKQGSSMLMDLWMYKGEHTKESRAFQSTMRFDFELFLSVFQIFMADSADLILESLPVEIVKVEAEKGTKEIVRCTRPDREIIPDVRDIVVTLGELARYFRMTGQLLDKRIKAEVQKRERAKGKGIYIDKDNKPYSIYEDGDIVDVVARDKELADKEKQDGTA